MKAKITSKGELIITPEKEIEHYALRQWQKDENRIIGIDVNYSLTHEDEATRYECHFGQNEVNTKTAGQGI